jgi:REP element-mobilizing transposase RayT
MTSFRQIIYHLVIATKNRKPSLTAEYEKALYNYIWGIIKEKKGHLYRINGVEDHIHILTDLHPTVALADLIKTIKVASNQWMKEHGGFPDFDSWAEGYAALTYAYRDKDMIINYIKKQKEHHKEESFHDELKRLLTEYGIEFEEKFLI